MGSTKREASLIPDAVTPGINDAASTFAEELADELRGFGIEVREDGADALKKAGEASLCGLAFSGGGIRSATFNLGIIQALCQLRLLRMFDYLSTVSGGGYIGGWLTALIRRLGNGEVEVVEEQLSPLSPAGDPRPDHPAVRYLRDYTNYLTPRRGLFSGDTWSAIATYARNFELNILCLILALAVPLIGLRLWVPVIEAIAHALGGALVYAVFVSLLAANFGIAMSLPSSGTSRSKAFHLDGRMVAAIIAILAVFAAVLLSYYVFGEVRVGEPIPRRRWLALGMLLYASQWAIGSLVYYRRPLNAALAAGGARSVFDRKAWSAMPRKLQLAALAALGSGAVAGILLALFASLTEWVIGPGDAWWQVLPDYVDPVGKWWAAGIGGGVMLLVVFCGTVVIHIGLVSRLWSDGDREWWSRLGGWLTAVALGWILVCGVVMYAPVLFAWAHQALLAAGGLSWLGSSLAGVLLGKRGSGGAESGRLTQWGLRIAPYAFVIGLMVVLSYGVHLALLALDQRGMPAFADSVPWREAVRPALMALATISVGNVIVALFACSAGALLFIWRVDVNVFSMNAFYRDRLIRCYLGASHATLGERSAEEFTGFDPGDDLPLASIDAEQRPLHLFGSTISLVRGSELAWQNRKAASFCFTPLSSGFALPPLSPGSPREAGCLGGYRPSSRYMAGVTLGNAMAISGAAVSPIMGYHTSPGIAFLLTVFNARLGRWCGNPCHAESWRRFGPRFGGWYLLRELFGLTDRGSPYVYLSDGEHFENLGIYELVRRRCRHVVAIDAGSDPGYRFENLANAIRKCYADFGVVIEIDVSNMHPVRDGRYVTSHCAFGDIRYPESGNAPGLLGRLLYVKASLDGSEPTDIMNYAIEHEEFPHESTANQFFDDAQFESYRKLGYRIGLSAFNEPASKAPEGREHPSRIAAGQLFEQMTCWGSPPEKATPHGSSNVS